MTQKFSVGDPVLLIYDQRRRWIRTVKDEQFHCNFGSVDLSELIDKPQGISLQTNKGKWLHAYSPSIIDWINNFEHRSQIIYEKDAAMILMLLDAKPGDTIYEAGTGSGALTAILARTVGGSGRVVTHDNREQAVEIAKKNLGKIGFENVDFNHCDVKERGFAEGIADSLILDMGDPWTVIEHVVEVVYPGSKIVIFLPTFDQLGKTAEKLEEYNFKDIKARELLEREIQLKPGAIRPSTRMIGHTGFLISALYKGKVNS